MKPHPENQRLLALLRSLLPPGPILDGEEGQAAQTLAERVPLPEGAAARLEAALMRGHAIRDTLRRFVAEREVSLAGRRAAEDGLIQRLKEMLRMKRREETTGSTGE